MCVELLRLTPQACHQPCSGTHAHQVSSWLRCGHHHVAHGVHIDKRKADAEGHTKQRGMTSSSTYSTPPPLNHHITPLCPTPPRLPQKPPTPHHQHPDAFTHHQFITLTPHCTSTSPAQRPTPHHHPLPTSNLLATCWLPAYRPISPPATLPTIPSRHQPHMTLPYPPTSLPCHPCHLYQPSPPTPYHHPLHPSQPIGVVPLTSSEVPEDHPGDI